MWRMTEMPPPMLYTPLSGVHTFWSRLWIDKFVSCGLFKLESFTEIVHLNVFICIIFYAVIEQIR